jgi:hypothetical protein
MKNGANRAFTFEGFTLDLTRGCLRFGTTKSASGLNHSMSCGTWLRTLAAWSRKTSWQRYSGQMLLRAMIHWHSASAICETL